MNKDNISVDVRLFTKLGSAVRGYADVSLELPEGTIVLNGFAIIEKDGKAPFVGLPSKPGTIQGKYFPVVDLQGEIHSLICKAILDAYEEQVTS